MSVPCKVVGKGIIVITLATFNKGLQQLIIVPANTEVKEHKHPNVIGLVRPLYGMAEGTKSGKTGFLDAGDLKVYTIQDGELHGLRTFEQPFVYGLEQIWLNGVKPTSIEQDWEGEPL